MGEGVRVRGNLISFPVLLITDNSKSPSLFNLKLDYQNNIWKQETGNRKQKTGNKKQKTVLAGPER